MKNYILGWGLLLCMVNLSNVTHGATLTVSRDGSGDYTSIQKAIDNLRAFTPEPHVLYLKPGVYSEKVVIPTWMTDLSILGEDAESTIVSWNDYSGKVEGMHTFNTFTTLINGNDIYVKNVTFQNNAEPLGQAVALHVEGDRVVFENCRFLGNQDTVYLGREGARQFFLNCYIEGTTDYIFGPSTALFINCHIHSKRNSYITAASTPKNSKFGFVFMDCNLTADIGVDKVYLGRPWRDFAQTVFVNCNMGKHIRPEGWHNWNRPEVESQVVYAEFGSVGEGSSSDNRVSWSKQLTLIEANKYSTSTILSGCDGWNPLLKINKQ